MVDTPNISTAKKEPCEALLALSADTYRYDVKLHASSFEQLFRCANSMTTLLNLLEGSSIVDSGGEDEDIAPLSLYMRGQILSALLALNHSVVMGLQAAIRNREGARP